MKTKRRLSGLSLVEVIIGMAILSLVMFMAYSVLFSSARTASQGEMTAGLEARGKKFIEFCKSDLYDARFGDGNNDGKATDGSQYISLGIHGNHTQIHYQRGIRLNPSAGVDYGYVGFGLINQKTQPTVWGNTFNSSMAQDEYDPWVRCSCVVRFEPEMILYESSSATSAPVVMPVLTDDPSAPQFYMPNPYTGAAIAPGSPGLPSKILNMDIDGDGLKTGVFVKGKIWKYVMMPYTSGTAPACWDTLYLKNPPVQARWGIVSSEGLSDDVLLAVNPADGTFQGNFNGPSVPAGKDWLFRYLDSEPFPATTYGNTSTTITFFPAAKDVGIAVTVWHGIVDDSGKAFWARKSWERIPFRLVR